MPGTSPGMTNDGQKKSPGREGQGFNFGCRKFRLGSWR